jgi:hypothetical protein
MKRNPELQGFEGNTSSCEMNRQMKEAMDKEDQKDM